MRLLLMILVLGCFVACNPPTRPVKPPLGVAPVDTATQIRDDLAAITSELKLLREELRHSREDEFNPLRIPGGW